MKFLSGLIFVSSAILGTATSGAYQMDSTCLIRQCNGATTDCAQASQASKACYAQQAARQKAEYDAKQAEYQRQHQAELDAAKKIQDANRAVNPH